MFKNARFMLLAALLPLVFVLAGCEVDPGKTIFGTPVTHHLVAKNSSDFNVEAIISPVASLPAPNADWQDVAAQYTGSPGRASWYLTEGIYYVYARYKARPDNIYLKGKAITLDSNNHNRTFEGGSVAAVVDVTPGHFTFAASATPPPVSSQ